MRFHKPEYFDVGDTWEIEGRLSYGDGTPFNLSAGCAIKWALQDTTGANVLAFSLGGSSPATGGIAVLDALGGRCLITVLPPQSRVIAVGKYTDQLQATDPSGYVSTQFQGTVNIKKSFFV
jgi:hypothetical protein